jgi:hypothetical protein
MIYTQLLVQGFAGGEEFETGRQDHRRDSSMVLEVLIRTPRLIKKLVLLYKFLSSNAIYEDSDMQDDPSDRNSRGLINS